MAITYHAGRRIQGLERVGSTLTDVDSPWTFANAQGSVSSGAVSFDYNQSTTDRGYHDLGANASGTWVFRFRLNITNKGNPSASNYLCKFGLGDNTNATSTSQGGIFFTLNHGSSYTRFGGFSSYNQIYQAGNWGSNSSTYGYSTSTNYYVEVARTGTTTATVKVFTNANYTDGLVFTNTLSSVDASLNVRYVKITTDPYGDQGSNRYNGTMDQMKFYDGVTSVVAIAGDVKPTNIQVGSRFEETDTRKMYHYNATGDVTTDGSYTVLKYTSDGTFTPTSAFNVEYLVVGGGGGAGKGGGGAGGFRTATGHAVTAQAYTITVGAGGSGGTATSNGSIGNDSIFDTITSTGGGYGGGGNQDGGAGGSGGGSGASNSATRLGGAGNTPSTLPSQGNAGGGNGGFTGAPYPSGGGGGAGAVGQTAPSSSVNGNGGVGTQSDILVTGSNVYYAGGGGCGADGASGTAGTGGLGGGGDGVGTGVSNNGTANTGGGAGGYGSPADGGDGGSGIVIIRFLTSGNTYTTSLSSNEWTEEGT